MKKKTQKTPALSSKLKVYTDMDEELNYVGDGSGGMFFVYFPGSKKLPLAEACRESLQYRWRENPTAWIGFKHTKVDAGSLMIFLNQIEEQLGVNEKSLVWASSRSNTVVIKPGKFWYKYWMRRSVLTLLIRMFVCHFRGNIWDAITNYFLTRRCVNGLVFFLSGYTTPKAVPSGLGFTDADNYSYGFSDRFADLTRQDVTSQLSRPKSQNA